MATAISSSDQSAIDSLKSQLASGKVANDPSGMQMTDSQKSGMQLQLDQLTGAKSQPQAQSEADQRTAATLQKSTTINNYGATTPEDIATQQEFNIKYGLPSGTGIYGSDGLAKAPIVKRDMAAEKAITDKYGAPQSADEAKNYHAMAYTPDQLAHNIVTGQTSASLYTPQELTTMGIDPQTLQLYPKGSAPGMTAGANPLYDTAALKAQGLSDAQIADLQKTGGAANQAQNQVNSLSGATNSNLRVLESALNKANNVTDQSVGPSQLYGQAGVGPALSTNALLQSLQQRGNEMKQNIDGFSSTVHDAAGTQLDAWNAANTQYKNTMDQYNKQVDRITTLNAQATAAEATLKAQQANFAHDNAMRVANAQDAYNAANGLPPGTPMPPSEVLNSPNSATKFTVGNTEYTGFTSDQMASALGIDPATYAAQCGHLVNQASGIGMGDSYAQKLGKTDPGIKTPQIGDIFVMPILAKNGQAGGYNFQGQKVEGGKYTQYGHTGIVQGLDANGNVLAYDANYVGNEKVGSHAIPASQITGYAQPTKGPLADMINKAKAIGQGTDKKSKAEVMQAYADAGLTNTASFDPVKAWKDYNLTGYLPTGAPTNADGSSGNDYSSFTSGLTSDQSAKFNSMPPLQQSNVKQLMNGDVLLSDLITSKGAQGAKDRQQLLQAAQSIDPNFSENTNKNRVVFQKAWQDPNGKTGTSIVNLNTAMGHLAEMTSALQTLKNTSSGVATMSANDFKNFLDKNSGDGNVQAFTMARDLFAGEIAVAYKGGGSATDPDIEKKAEAFSENLTSGGFGKVADQASTMLGSKISSLGQEYKRAMGKYPPESIIDDTAIQSLKDAGVDTSKIESIVNAQQNGQGAATQTNAEKFDAKTNIAADLKAGHSAQEIVAAMAKVPQYADHIQGFKNISWDDNKILEYYNQ